jgi:O-antigen biosynthesis protein
VKPITAPKKLVIIGLVWPEPQSSAAGSRMLQLIQLFLDKKYSITFCSAASHSPFQANLTALGVKSESIQLNDDSFDSFIKKETPDFVLFDRYLTEEQYGWRVAASCPNAIRILDTEDLHCLRYVRQEALKKKVDFKESDLLTSEFSFREIASILRCDITLMVSEYEMYLLKDVFKLNPILLHYLPLFYSEITEENAACWNPFEKREHCVFMGNFLHQPNADAVNYLKTDIWPLIRAKLPTLELHIYGAYANSKIEQLNSVKQGFIVKGRADDALKTLSNYRINFAPLRFGAGIKGKLLDAMLSGTPSITTSIGAESMTINDDWAGLISDDIKEMVEGFEQLYHSPTLWKKTQLKGAQIINTRFEKSSFEEPFFFKLTTVFDGLKQHRLDNFMGGLLHHHTLQSTKYMSKWIALKNIPKED